MLSGHHQKRKWNWLDFCFVVFLLALIATLLFRFHVIDWFLQDRSAQKAEISFSVSNLPSENATVLKSGTLLYFENDQDATKQDNYLIGKLETVTTENAKLFLPDEDGQLQTVYSKTAKDVFATVTVSGKQRESGFYLNNSHYLAPGLLLTVQTQNQQFEILILDVVIQNT